MHDLMSLTEDEVDLIFDKTCFACARIGSFDFSETEATMSTYVADGKNYMCNAWCCVTAYKYLTFNQK